MARKNAEPSFEDAVGRLEQLADELESGDLKLEDAIRKYEEGVKLYARCQDILSKAEKKVQMLVRDAEGTLKAVPFEPEETDPTEGSKGTADTDNVSEASDARPRRGGSRRDTNLF